MPVVIVTALAAPPAVVDRVLSSVVEHVAQALACPAQDVWASFVPAIAQHVGQRAADTASQCPIVVIRGRARGQDTVAAALGAAARAVAAELSVGVDDVWLQWIDVTTGYAFAGGDVV